MIEDRKNNTMTHKSNFNHSKPNQFHHKRFYNNWNSIFTMNCHHFNTNPWFKSSFQDKNPLKYNLKPNLKNNGNCYNCNNTWHRFHECTQPKKNHKWNFSRNDNIQNNNQPKVNEVVTQNVVTITPTTSPHDLLRVSSLVNDNPTLVLFYDISTHNIIIHDLATEGWFFSMMAEGAFDQPSIKSTPLINKVSIKIQGYKDKHEFIMTPLKHTYIIIGMSWRGKFDPTVSYAKKYNII